jgi:hypothetical protein
MRKTILPLFILSLILFLNLYSFSQVSIKDLIGTWEGEATANMPFHDETITSKMIVKFEENGTCLMSPEDDEPAFGTYIIVDNKTITLVISPPYEEYEGGFHNDIEFTGKFNPENRELIIKATIETPEEEYEQLKELMASPHGDPNFKLPKREELTSYVTINLFKK